MPRPIVSLVLAALATLAFAGVVARDGSPLFATPGILLLGGALVTWLAPGSSRRVLRRLAVRTEYGRPPAAAPTRVAPVRRASGTSQAAQLTSLFRTEDPDAEILAAIYSLSPANFEHFAAMLLVRMGYLEVQVMGKSGDNGVDVMMRDAEGGICVAQCKRYRGNVSPAIVRELLGVMTREGATQGFLITTGRVSAGAESWAGARQIKILDAPRLVSHARRYMTR